MRQQNQLLIRALRIAVGVLAAASPAGLAAPAAVHVRVEGVHETLFDRVVLTDGHDVRATSDVVAHRCDGTNGGAHPDAGPTATAATVDALATRGATFDGTWSAGYEDWFVRRLGAEAEDDAWLRWWGLLVNGEAAGAGGCQVRVGAGDEVLWANDAFSGRPFLRLAAPATVPLGEPLELTVTAGAGAPYAGALVEAVDADGRPAAGVADGSVSAADGSATVVFHATGWQRAKARVPVADPADPDASPAAIASNSVDACVEATPGAGCAGQPPSRIPLVPPATATPAEPPPSPTPGDPPVSPLPPSVPPTSSVPAGPHARLRPLLPRRLATGARLRLRRPAGRTAFALRPLSRRATVELRAGGRRVRVALARRGGTRVVRAPRLPRAGWVELRALRGSLRVALPSRAATAAAAAREDARLDRTVRFLQDAQNADGGFGGTRGAPSDPTFSAWVALALAAAGVNPRDQARPGGGDAYAYLTAHAAELSATTDFERAALVAVAAGASPRDFGGVDLVAAILGRQLPSGAFAGQADGTTGYVNATAFALLPLSALREPALEPALRRGADWLAASQEPSGAWGFAPGREPSSDTTAAVLQALHAVGRGGTPQEARAWAWLRSLRNADGGYGFGDALPQSNTASTAWVAQAMWAAGEDPASALAYLASLQRPDGSIAWRAGEDANAVWMTAYAAPAYAGRALPIAAVPRAAPIAPDSPAPAEPVPPAAARGTEPIAGEGGVGRAGGGLAIAGGGGNGAPLFSAPRPGSRGRTPGAVRDAGRTVDLGRSRRPRSAVLPASGEARHGAADARAPVSGIVLGDRRAAAAPGVRGASAGGRAPGPALPLALTAALALCAALGAAREHRPTTRARA